MDTCRFSLKSRPPHMQWIRGNFGGFLDAFHVKSYVYLPVLVPFCWSVRGFPAYLGLEVLCADQAFT